MTHISNVKKHHPKNSKCSECLIVSKQVYKSYKYNALLCADCLTQKLLKDIK